MRWLDNGLVQLISTFIGPELGVPVKRWNGKEKKMIEVQCPAIINQYNKHMGGVDLCDMLMSLYRIKLGTKKWYMHLVYYCIGLSIVKDWLLYKRHAFQNQDKKIDIMSLLDFHSRIALSLLQENKVAAKRGRPRSDNTPTVQKKSKSNLIFLPPNEIRYDNVCNLPEITDAQHRCRYCPKGYTRIKCLKCDVF